jgi:hypothetical protein
MSVIMKNIVSWDIELSSYLTGDITSPLQSPAGQCYVRFEVFTAATMNNTVFWDVTSCGSCKNRRFEETYVLHQQGSCHSVD